MTAKTNASTAKFARSLRAAAAGLMIALAASGVAAAPALASTTYREPQMASQTAQARREGDAVTIRGTAGGDIFAEWHRDADGDWWATFLTNNYTKVYARTAEAGCGWVFYAANGDGTLTQVTRTDRESTQCGEVGPEGAPSHWQELDGGRWF